MQQIQHEALELLVEDYGPVIAIDMVLAVKDAREEFGKIFAIDGDDEIATTFKIATTVITEKE